MTLLTREALSQRRDQTRAEEQRLRDQRDQLLARAQADDALTDPGIKEKLDRLQVGIDRAEEQALEAGRAVLNDVLAKGDYVAEDGTDFGAPERGGAGFNTSRVGNPWDTNLVLRAGTSPQDELRARALTCNERSDLMPDAAREYMAKVLQQEEDPEGLLSRYTIESSSPAYFRAFAKWFNDPQAGSHEWAPDEREAWSRVKQIGQVLERASMGIGSAGIGGALVPYSLDPNILISSVGSVNPMRDVARVETTAYNTKKFVTSTGVTSHWYNENSETSDDSPALLQPSVDCQRASAFVTASIELAEDSDITQQLGGVFADSKAQEEARVFTVGTGVAPEPAGIITHLVAAGGSTVIATASNVLALGDLLTNQAALPPRWRANARWMMNLSIINGYRQVPAFTGATTSVINDSTSPPRALGWEVRENSNMDGTLTGAAADYALLSGDFKQWVIVDRIGSRIEFLPHMLGANRRPLAQRGFLMLWRVGTGLLVADAFRLSNFST